MTDNGPAVVSTASSEVHATTENVERGNSGSTIGAQSTESLVQRYEINVGYMEVFVGKKIDGAVRDVIVGVAKKTGQKVCLKSFSRGKVQLELAVLSKLVPGHPNLISCFGTTSIHGSQCLCYEFFDTNLRTFVANSPVTYPVTKRLAIMKQAIAGINFMHSHQVVHRDIKSANLFFSGDPRGDVFCAKWADLGLACGFESVECGYEVGTYRWMAPEIIRHHQYDEKCDIYSLGLVFWELFEWALPFAGIEALNVAWAVAKDKSRPNFNPALWTPTVQALVNRSWSDNPELRPNASELCELIGSMIS